MWEVCGEVDGEHLGPTAGYTRLGTHQNGHGVNVTNVTVQTSSHWLHLQEPC